MFVDISFLWLTTKSILATVVFTLVDWTKQHGSYPLTASKMPVMAYIKWIPYMGMDTLFHRTIIVYFPSNNHIWIDLGIYGRYIP